MDVNLLKKIIQKVVKEEIQEVLPNMVSKVIKESVKEEIKELLYEQFTSGNGASIKPKKQNSYTPDMSLDEILGEDEPTPDFQPQQYYNQQPQRPLVNTGNPGINSILNEMVQTGYEHVPSEYAGAGNPLMELGYGKTSNVNMSNYTGIQPGASSYMGSAGAGYLQKMSDDEVLINPKRSSFPQTSAVRQAQNAITRDYSAVMKRLNK